jgi:hypothetical protein
MSLASQRLAVAGEQLRTALQSFVEVRFHLIGGLGARGIAIRH